MNKPAAILPRLFFVMALGLTLAACTVTDPSSSSRSTGGDGSSSLTSDGLLKQDHKIQEFARANFEKLKEDMALGQGEYLASLAALMGVEKAHQPEFFAFTKEKFPSVFSSDQITSTEMLATLNRELLADPRFNKLVAHN
jgi:hypothetical protein